ncbi:MAG: hypothetical protein QM813_08100 [Verrucomicrobiota bacterium]
MTSITGGTANRGGWNSIQYSLRVAVVLLVLFAGPAKGQAQSRHTSKHAINGGGGISQGGDYQIKGSIGIVDQKPASRGESYTLSGGVVALVTAVQTPDAPTLHLSVTNNTVILSWTTATSGYVLEQTTVADNSTWAPVDLIPAMTGEKQTVLLPMTSGNKFFRLRKP